MLYAWIVGSALLVSTLTVPPGCPSNKAWWQAQTSTQLTRAGAAQELADLMDQKAAHDRRVQTFPSLALDVDVVAAGKALDAAISVRQTFLACANPPAYTP